jgi:AcrR family transcriptional regulator
MNTKNTIKQKALELFNKHGMLNITLRHVAEKLDKSYGNITYHYKTKEHVITELYSDMVLELKTISANIFTGKDMFTSIITAPVYTFDLSLRYLFLFKDFVEIKRNYPAIAKKIDKSNAERKQGLKQALIILQQQGILRPDLQTDDLDYLMELSGAVRTFFFLNLSPEDYKKKDLKKNYVDYTNNLLLPYLTSKGKQLYQKQEESLKFN